MSKINVLLANSAGEFNKTQIDIINAIKEVERYVFSKLKIDWNIDLVVNNRMDFFGNSGRWRGRIYLCE